LSPLKFVAPIVLAALVFPAATKQWQDREEELQLKTTLLQTITRSASEALSGGRVVVGKFTPEFARYRALKDLAEDETDGAARSLAEERANAYAAQDARYHETREDWIITSVSTRGTLLAHFPPGAAKEWRKFSEAVLAYIRLSSSIDGDERAKEVQELDDFLGSESKLDLAVLSQSPVADGYFEAYEGIRKKLATKLNVLVAKVVDSDTSTFSVGWGDFWNDVRLSSP
jgi:hypothetical protein